MKNLNKKGLTLTELIVSITLVSVASIYFFQTLYVVKNIYITTKKDTQDYVDTAYNFRIMNANIENDKAVCEAIKKDDCSSNTDIYLSDDPTAVIISATYKGKKFYKYYKINEDNNLSNPTDNIMNS